MASLIPFTPYPQPDAATVWRCFAGMRLSEVEGPVAVVDRAIVKRNCDAMLNSAERLGVGFRAHVKTHKTTQIASLQVGETGPVNLIGSTLLEMEQLLPYLEECKKQGRKVSLLYGVPAPPSSIHRLAEVVAILGSHRLFILVDHEESLEYLSDLAIVEVGLFVKVDTGYRRSGLPPASEKLESLVRAIHTVQKRTNGGLFLEGFYSHMGNSYSGNHEIDALSSLKKEIEGVVAAAEVAAKVGYAGQRFTLSVGATPTATAVQNLLSGTAGADVESLIERTKKVHDVELHAGVYPFLDMQQLATHARPASFPVEAGAPLAGLSTSEIGLRILVEVASLYTDREKPEALIAAGSMALGREPCKSYPGWGVVSPWRQDGIPPPEPGEPVYGEDGKTGWIVGRISQEHGILTWEGPQHKMRKLHIGEKLLIWSNHACIAGAGFGWYLVVDSDDKTDPDGIKDVWIRWRGW